LGKWVATVVLQWLVWGKTFDQRVWLSLLPVVGGIVLTSFTELSFNLAGFLAAFLGCMVTSTKTILAESLLHGYNFDRYIHIKPIADQCSECYKIMFLESVLGFLLFLCLLQEF
jgi:drug/metabolite transporter (DMT)-like permease